MEYLQYLKPAKQKIVSKTGKVLNLIINGIPSIPNIQDKENALKIVLNLIINGIPSIQL